MLESLDLAWRLLAAFPAQAYLNLLPWHFTAVLIVLGVLASFGLHHLVGYTFRFYSPDGRHRTMLAAVTLVVLMASVLALLLAYLVRTQAVAMIKPALTPENAVQPAAVLGSILLDPPLSDPDLSDETHVAKDRLAAVIVSMDDEDYRADLQQFLVPPDKLVLSTPPAATAPTPPAQPNANPGTPPAPAPAPPPPPAAEPGPAVITQRDDLISAILVQIGVRWMLDPDQTWPQGMPAGTGSTAAQSLRLPEFALALVDEIQDDAVLDRLDWEHVAGSRFVQVVLQPILVELMGRWAGLLALGVLALNLAYFAIAARVVGSIRRRSRKEKTE